MAERVITRQPLRAVDDCEATALSSAHDRAASLRLHQALPAVEGISTADRLAVRSRDQARRLSANARRGHDWADRFPAIVDATPRIDGEACSIGELCDLHDLPGGVIVGPFPDLFSVLEVA